MFFAALFITGKSCNSLNRIINYIIVQLLKELSMTLCGDVERFPRYVYFKKKANCSISVYFQCNVIKFFALKK